MGGLFDDSRVSGWELRILGEEERGFWRDHKGAKIDAAALAVAETPEQVVEILRYVTTQF